MIVAGSASPLLLSSAGGYNLTKSLRFRSSASAYLDRTQGTSTNQLIGTWSLWFKRGALGSTQRLLEGYTASSDTGVGALEFGSDNKLYFFGWATNWRVTTQVFRDPSAWYHIVLTVDTTQSTASNRVRLYVNGSEITAFDTSNNPTQNNTFGLNNNSAVLQIGRRRNVSNNDNFFDGYMTELNFIDGQALTPSSFGETSTSTGVWIPKKYTGTYGTNGFYLPFTDVATTSGSNAGLGKDFSGNGNYWTTNNISVTTGTTYDSMSDVPTLTSATTANYCTLNPLDKATNFSVADGNLNFTPANTSDLYSCRSTIQIPSTGKWIWEVTNTNSAYMITAGLLSGSTPTTGQQTVSCASMTVGSIGTFFSTTQWMNTTTTWSVTNIGNGDTLVIAYDADGGYIWFGRVASGGTTVTWYNTSGTADPSTGTDPRASGITAGGWFAGFGTYYTPSGASANFGQRPFSFTNIPTGFKALNTFNLPTPTIGATASTTANKYFDVSLYTGNGSTQSITNSGSMQPDWAWIKVRSSAASHALADSVRGSTVQLASNLTDAEITRADTVTSFNSNGFSLGANTTGYSVNLNTATYVAWQWRASNTTAVTNTAGSITSTVSANTTAGFSIVTGTLGGVGVQDTVGHGLGVAPKMIIFKTRSGATYNWSIYHASVCDTTSKYFRFTTDALQTYSTTWGSALPTSTVFGVTGDGCGSPSNPFVAYCFAQVAGYSAFGSYTGNGSSDGPFVYLGFRPRYIMIKSTVETSNWFVYDTARDTYNIMDSLLFPSDAGAEYTDTGYALDALSNGFKIRATGTYGGYNNNGNAYIYACFAETPFKYALAR